MLRRSDFDCNPIKPQRVYHEMNKVFGPETLYFDNWSGAVAAKPILHVYRPPLD